MLNVRFFVWIIIPKRKIKNAAEAHSIGIFCKIFNWKIFISTAYKSQISVGYLKTHLIMPCLTDNPCFSTVCLQTQPPQTHSSAYGLGSDIVRHHKKWFSTVCNYCSHKPCNILRGFGKVIVKPVLQDTCTAAEYKSVIILRLLAVHLQLGAFPYTAAFVAY